MAGAEPISVLDCRTGDNRPVTDPLCRSADDTTRSKGTRMSDNPLLDTLADMTAASVDRALLSEEDLLLVRLAALVAVDAPVASYLVTLTAGLGTELTLEDARSVLIAVAPIVGGPKVVTATGRIAEALGFAALAIDEIVDEVESEEA